MRVLFLFLLSCFTADLVFAQCTPGPLLMSGGTFTVTEGCVLQDNGGGAAYTETDYTMILCPDVAGDVVQLTFNAFALQTSQNANNSDYLSIFDGNSTAGMTLGDYTGTALQGTQVTGTVNNTSGCLTLVFSTNGADNGTAGTPFPGFEATISTTTPCANPTVNSEIVSPSPVDPALQTVNVCVGSVVTFGDNGSIGGAYPPGQNYSIVNYIWDFDDGTVVTNNSPANIQHSFSEPGEYIVTLTLEDNNYGGDAIGCRNLNLQPLQVLVSTSPTFTGMIDLETCLGDTVLGLVEVGQSSPLEDLTNIGGSADGTTWTALPPQVVSGQTYLADGAGFSYSSTINFDFFPAGSTLENCDDFLAVFVNMEHSYAGDLSLSISCPDGTTVDLVAYPSGGGGTYIGEPIDDGSGGSLLDMGVGYDYIWQPNTPNPTWTGAFGAGGYTVPSVGTPANNALESGIYAAVGNLCDFVGCPLNGGWTFSVLDNLGADNGYIFQWGINLNPALYPDVTTFTPTIGPDADSSYWVTTGPGSGIQWITDVTTDGDAIEIVPMQTGVFEYTYYVINSFGCSFDTTMTVTVTEAPQVTAGMDLNYNCGALVLDGGLIGEPPVACADCGSYNYCYTTFDYQQFTYCPDVAGAGFVTLSMDQGSVDFNDQFAVYDGANTWPSPWLGSFTGDLSGMSWTSTDASGCLTIVISEWDGVTNCNDGGTQELIYSISAGSAVAGSFQWEWTPAIPLDNPSIPNPTVISINQTTTFTLYGHPNNYPGCWSSDEVVVSVDPLGDPGLDATITVCPNAADFNMVDFLGGNPVNTGVWADATGNALPDGVYSPAVDSPGNYEYTVTSGDCSLSSVLTIDSPPALSSALQGFPGIQVCDDGEVDLDTNYVQGSPPFMFEWSFQGETLGTSAQETFNPDSSGYALLSITDECDFEWSDSLLITVFPRVNVSFEADTTEGCWPNVFALSCEDIPMHQIRWDLSDGSSYVNNSSFSHAFENPGDYGVTLTYTNPLGCEYSASIPSFLHSYQAPGAGYRASPQPTNIENTEITFTDFSEGNEIVSYQWSFFDSDGNLLGASNQQNPIFDFPSSYGGDYNVQLAVTDVHGCRDIISDGLISIDDLLQFYVASAFTPNGDGLNDVMMFEGADIDETRFSIFIMNRWGEAVYKSKDPKKAWLGGTTEGDYYLPNGVYFWRATIVSKSTGEKRELEGNITLMR